MWYVLDEDGNILDYFGFRSHAESYARLHDGIVVNGFALEASLYGRELVL